MQPMIEWLENCYGEGILNENNTGLPLSKMGSAEFIETLTRKIALREGFGDVLAQRHFKGRRDAGEKSAGTGQYQRPYPGQRDQRL